MSTQLDEQRSVDDRDEILAYVRSIVDTVREPLLVLDDQLRVQSANRSFYETFQVSPAQTEGQRLYDLGNGQWDIPPLRTLLDDVLSLNAAFDDYEVAHDFPGIGPKVMRLNARRLRHAGTERILLAMEDVTERRQLEAQRQELETRFTALVKNVTDHAIFTLDPDGRISSWNLTAEHILGYCETDVLGRHFAFIFTPEDCQQGIPETELRTAREQGRAEDERWHLRQSGERFWALGIVSALYDADGRLTGFAKILRDITERKQAELALHEADQRKDAFLATLAHELRNPLAPIRTSLDLLQIRRGDDSVCMQPLEIIDRQLGHLVRLVDDLMDVSRISRGKIQLQTERLDLAEVAQAALEISEGRLSGGSCEVIVSLPAEPQIVIGDRVRLVQMVANLLNNAAKFTGPGGHIRLDLVPRGDRVTIQVQDDGRGIPAEQLDAIFEPFAQAESGGCGGLGIGLALVRSLATLHGGEIVAESDGPGRGATFTLSLPRCCARSSAVTESDASEPAPLAHCRVLVVDDNRDIVESAHQLLTLLKAEVRVAYSGAEALQVSAHWLPTHVLMDLGMPEMDGYETARRLRAEHAEHSFKLIALTGSGQDEDRKRAHEAGFDQLLLKPVRAAELKAAFAT